MFSQRTFAAMAVRQQEREGATGRSARINPIQAGITALIVSVHLCLATVSARASEVIPPAPTAYFNDYAHVVSGSTADQLNAKLAQFERDTSNQIVVAIFPKMESDSSIEDYTVRVAQKWQVGQKAQKNGAVLFVFIQDHKVYLQVGYGLESAIPDALAKRIIDNEITPRFKQGDFNGGLTAGVNAVMAAAKGEYKGTGQTVHQKKEDTTSFVIFVIIVLLFLFFALLSWLSRAHAYTVYSSGGRNTGIAWWALLNTFLDESNRSSGYRHSWYDSGSSGGGWSGGGGGSSGGFSSGGGSFGGGGAGGSW